MIISGLFTLITAIIVWKVLSLMASFRDHTKYQNFAYNLLYHASDSRFIETIGLSRAAFTSLVGQLNERLLLPSSGRMSHEETLLIFMFVIRSGATLHSTSCTFSRQPSTVYEYVRSCLQRSMHSADRRPRAFYESLDALYAFSSKHIQQQIGASCDSIRWDSRFAPYFNGCIGIFESFSLSSDSSGTQSWSYRHTSDTCNFTMCAVVGFDMRFAYLQSGFEGTKGGNKMLLDATWSDLVVPKGQYVLTSPHYTGSALALTPYPGIEYPFQDGNVDYERPKSKEELFNLRHAQLFGIVHKVITALQSRFRMLLFQRAGQFTPDVQARLLRTVVGLHNWLVFQRLADPILQPLGVLDVTHEDLHGFGAEWKTTSEPRESALMARTREDIADGLWTDFQRYKIT